MHKKEEKEVNSYLVCQKSSEYTCNCPLSHLNITPPSEITEEKITQSKGLQGFLVFLIEAELEVEEKC